jgi:hypothetical protein
VTLYSLDTSALMDAWHRHYPVDVIPALWRAIEEGVTEGRFFAAEEVKTELARKDDDLLKWARRQRGFFVDLDAAQQAAVAEVLHEFPRLIGAQKGRSGADPFVIALARTRGAVVVTGENDDGSPDRPKIPLVCRHFGIRAIKPLEFIRENRWVFSHRQA